MKIVRNDKGNRMLDCMMHNFIVTNKFYECREIHKYTIVEMIRDEKSITGYMLWKWRIENVDVNVRNKQ